MNLRLKSQLQKVIQAFQGESFDEARLILDEVLKHDINSADNVFELGIAYVKANRLVEASTIFCTMQSYKNDDVRIPYNLGLIYSIQGNHLQALQSYDLALEIQPDDIDAMINKSSVFNEIKNYTLALSAIEEAIKIRPDIPEAWLNKGIALNNLNLYEESIRAYDKAIILNPNFHEAWSNKSVPLNKLKRYFEAYEVCDKALSLKPDYAEAWCNKGIASNELKYFDEAISYYDKALSLKPDYAEAWCCKGVTLYVLKNYEEAIVHLDKALSLKSDYAEAFCNKGAALDELRRFEEGIAQYVKALNLNPDYAEAWCNKGVTLHKLKYYEGAIDHYDKAIRLKSDFAEAWCNKGVTLHELKRFDEALSQYEKALSVDANIDWLYGNLAFTRMKISKWSNLADLLEIITKKVMANEKVTRPFPLLSLIDDSLLHKKSSEIYVQNMFPENLALGPIQKHRPQEKIRIGYFSADFKNHPVSSLTAELYELHDRNKFEIIAFSFGVDDKSPMRLRLNQAFDRFIDVSNMSDMEIAKLSRELKIDIAVDLGGYTSDSRTGIFSYRAAPIQVNWLGYPGTIAADYIDYIVADDIVIPAQSTEFYHEKVVSLPNSYIVDDAKRIASSRKFTREECGIPENTFIFCCFNNDYKFNPQVLDSWARILLEVKHSILWVSKNNEYFRKNITSEFENRGIFSDRIIFADRLDLMEDHLARYALADLFLDTYPYNAHTTAIDSLKVGIPVLTLMGESFASRVAASLLNSIGLPELITTSQEDYEALAIDLAKNPSKLADIKQKLIQNRLSTPLFNTPLFTKNLETAYIKMMERYEAGLQPDNIHVNQVVP